MSDREIVLTGVDASAWDLAAGPLFSGPDQPLWGMPPVAVSSRTAILAPGSVITGVQHSSRDLVVPLRLNAADQDEADDTLRAFARALDPLRGDVTVVVTDSAGNSRQIEGTYLGGWESVALAWCRSAEASGRILLLCANPYWRNTVDDTEIFDATFAGPSTGFDDAGTDYDEAWPFDGEGGGQYVFALDNTGDVDAWPVFTIVGPASITGAIALPSGKAWRLDDLLDGETLVINTDPRQAQVTVNGNNAYGRLADNPTLWTLPTGTTAVALQLAGADGGSSYEVRWRPQFLSA